MTLSERLLLALSRNPGAADYESAKQHWTLATALKPLFKSFPQLQNKISGARVLDFGCGEGWQVLGFANLGALQAVGIEANPGTLQRAQLNARDNKLDDCVQFFEQVKPEMIGAFDIVISQNSMEHFPDPLLALQEMTKCLAAGGEIYISFGPPWYAPYGSHMFFFTRLPWVNLLFTEKTVMNVRKFFRNDGAKRYEDVESGLNRMTLHKFESIIAGSGLKVDGVEYRTVKNIPLAGRVPLIRELFVNYVTCVLTRS